MAATKHLRDAQALHDAGRPDGCAYLAGYVVECSLKAVLLHDKAWDPMQGQHDATLLATWHQTLRGPAYGHKMVKLASQQLGAAGAKYWPDLPHGGSNAPLHSTAAVLRWKETIRYQGEDPDARQAALRASSYLEWATHVHDCAIVEMRLDGVL